MSHENYSNELEPIGDPIPINASTGRKILKRVAAALVISVGGFLTFAVMVMPTRCRGASSSSKLLWQQRQKEIARSIDAARLKEAEIQPGAERQQSDPTKQ